MTPKLKLSDAERKVSLSWILKFFLPGNCRTRMSIHIIDAPRTHAISQLATCIQLHFRVGASLPMPLRQVIIHPLSSFDRPMLGQVYVKYDNR